MLIGLVAKPNLSEIVCKIFEYAIVEVLGYHVVGSFAQVEVDKVQHKHESKQHLKLILVSIEEILFSSCVEFRSWLFNWNRSLWSRFNLFFFYFQLFSFTFDFLLFLFANLEKIIKRGVEIFKIIWLWVSKSYE